MPTKLKHNSTTACECGNQKPTGKACCTTCFSLDQFPGKGGTAAQFAVLQELRASEPASQQTLQLATSYKDLTRTLQALMKKGLVRRVYGKAEGGALQYQYLLGKQRASDTSTSLGDIRTCADGTRIRWQVLGKGRKPKLFRESEIKNRDIYIARLRSQGRYTGTIDIIYRPGKVVRTNGPRFSEYEVVGATATATAR